VVVLRPQSRTNPKRRPPHRTDWGVVASTDPDAVAARLSLASARLKALQEEAAGADPACARLRTAVADLGRLHPELHALRARLEALAAAVEADPVASIRPVTTVADLPLLAAGKVREMYDLGDRVLMVASDRISTYDVVHPTPIPDKGAVLTGLSAFWFSLTEDLVPNHMLSVTDGVPDEVRGRAMVVRKLRMVPLECVVRGYITGSGWKDYQRDGTVAGIRLPDGLRESQQLPESIFTPSTKAEVGHDETVDLERAAELVGDPDLLERLRERSLALYARAADHARERGVILADTKFEFGLDADGELRVGDEVLTPDSSRFWPADGYQPGRPQPSFDKQYVRDWASGTGWDKRPPAPAIPDDVVARTREKYVQAYERIAGEPFAAWLERTGG
jgi:phosphoribosylaminoimidazole-succinocarboxamide synthase